MDDFIGIYDEAISADHCESLIKFINKLEECDNLGTPAVGRHTTDHKSYNASCNFHTTAGSWLGTNFLPYIQDPVNDYLQKYSVLGRARFLLYDVKAKKIPLGGGFHNWHYENCSIASCTRQFVIQAYLNDSFEGGETEFLYLNKRISAKQGRIIIFPAGFTHVHRGNPPIGGEKYIATSWGLVQGEEGEIG